MRLEGKCETDQRQPPSLAEAVERDGARTFPPRYGWEVGCIFPQSYITATEMKPLLCLYQPSLHYVISSWFCSLWSIQGRMLTQAHCRGLWTSHTGYKLYKAQETHVTSPMIFRWERWTSSVLESVDYEFLNLIFSFSKINFTLMYAREHQIKLIDK